MTSITEIEQRVLDIEQNLANIMAQMAVHPDSQVSGPDSGPAQPQIDPDQFAEYGFFSSIELIKNAQAFAAKTGGHTAPAWYLPDLPGFNDRSKAYYHVIDQQDDLTDLQKAVYSHSLKRGAFLWAWNGKHKPRTDATVSKIVPVGQPGGRGRISYGYQATGKVWPGAIMAVGVTDLNQALEHQKRRIDNFFGFESIYDRAY